MNPWLCRLLLVIVLTVFTSEARAEWVTCQGRQLAVDQPALTGFGSEVYFPSANTLVFRDAATREWGTCVPVGFGWTIDGFWSFHPPDAEAEKGVILLKMSAGGDFRYFEINSGRELYFGYTEDGKLDLQDNPGLVPGTPVPVLQDWVGGASLITQPEYHFITDQETWSAVWTRHQGKNISFPWIDFQMHNALAIFAGEQINSLGIKIKEIRDTGEAWEVYFYSVVTKPAGPNASVRPYGFFMIPQTKKKIILKESVQSLTGGPPQWRVVKEFLPAGT